MTDAPADSPYEVTSDGKTVWVNHIGCVARFGPSGYEVDDLTILFARKGSGLEGLTTTEDWTAFVNRVKKNLGVTVEDHHKPTRLVSEPGVAPS